MSCTKSNVGWSGLAMARKHGKKVMVVISIVLLLFISALDVLTLLSTDGFFLSAQQESRTTAFESLASRVVDKLDAFVGGKVNVKDIFTYDTRNGSAWTDPNDIAQYISNVETHVAIDPAIFACYLGAPNRDVYKLHRTNATQLYFEHRHFPTQKKRSFGWLAGENWQSKSYGDWADKSYDVFNKGWYKAGSPMSTDQYYLAGPVLERYGTDVHTYIELVFPLIWPAAPAGNNSAVMKVEFFTDALNAFVRGVKIGSRGSLYITTGDGTLVAVPDSKRLF